jgi:hypothetical protein
MDQISFLTNLIVFIVQNESVVGDLRNVTVRLLEKLFANLAAALQTITGCWVEQNWRNVFESGGLGVVLKPEPETRLVLLAGRWGPH